MSNKIDVHHHFYPEVFTEALQRAGGDPSGWFVPEWTLEADQELSKSIGVQIAILSMTAPGACIETEPKAAAILARKSNEAAASLRDKYPISYGFFASLPNLQDKDETLEELAYALDTLKADGVILFTRYGDDNHYLGNEDFRPIWQELNRRKAVVFIHPTHPVDTHLVNSHLPQPMFDYPHETGRTAIDMILSDTLSLTPDCKIILSHAGGTLPYLIDRVAGMLPHTPFSVGKTTGEILKLAKTFYFDTALSSNPVVLDLLLKFAEKGHVLFGSDFPNAPNEGIRYYTQQLEGHVSDEAEREIAFENALALFPRLRRFAKRVFTV